MKLKSDLILREVAGQYVVVPVGRRVQEITSIVYISASGAYLWPFMQENDFDTDILVNRIMEHYTGVTEEQARADIENFLKTLKDSYMLDDGTVHGYIEIRGLKK